ncbi:MULTISPECIES: hypothetical protein [Pseudomonas]|uniref:Uncharacterized protein n=1 Tax=Pseudomonas putida S13.1.2 TaxID=1384061 RepID=A0AAU8S5K0_PSEPU|nr:MULTISPECIES: hypothetical protein [Pseudomonas]AJQ48467.1 hypothetical protein N805_15160 [Pseudomonas putida S13.1.2]
MSNDSARLLAAKVRLDYQKQRVARLAAHKPLALDDPHVEHIVDPADGTLHRDALDADLPVSINEWDNLPETGFGDIDVLQLEMARVDGSGNVGDFLEVGIAHECDADTTFPLAAEIPQEEYPSDGKRQLRYRIDRYNHDTPEYSNAISLIFDRTPPWGRDFPAQAVLAGNLITDAFFTANPTGLKVTLPAYEGQDAKDTYALFYTSTPLQEGQIPTPIDKGTLPANRELLIAKDKIEALGDGLFYVSYLLADKATNLSMIGLPVEVDVNLGELPLNLQDPVVPLAADGLIDLGDAQTGVTVEIPQFDNHLNTDNVEVTWGTSEAIVEQIGSREFPVSISIPADNLRLAYGAADAVVATPVSYRILRHRVPYGPNSIEVDVDFSVAGPVDPDPDWPNPVHPGLLAPEVQGAVSKTPNVLDRSDAGQPAKLTFTLYENAKDDELVEFYWNGTQVPEAQHTVDTNADPEIEVSIPWTYIEAAGNNAALPVHYTIRKPTGAGNERRSISALVDVDAVTIVLAPAAFERTSTRGWLNCDSLWEDSQNPAGDPAFKVSVGPLDKYLPSGGVVNMSWTAWGGRSGDNPIPGAGLQEPVTITPAQAKDGFAWEVKPYDDHILPIYDPTGFGQDGRGRVQYSLEFNGETVHSEPIETVVSLGTGSGTCPIPPAP